GVTHAQRMFQVDLTWSVKAGGQAQALAGDVHTELVVRQLNNRHAGALDGDGVTQLGGRTQKTRSADGKPHAGVLPAVGQWLDVGNRADCGDYSCEHGAIPF